jgi:methylenetetrahydrofolate dehydrogenase (NADP+)/methenyltetrahydrofolate cyclohydrolase
MKILDGKLVSEKILNDIKDEIISSEVTPKIAIIMIGENQASETYVKNKMIASKKCGIKSILMRFSEDISEKEILNVIDNINDDDSYQGMIVQMPIPEHINSQNIINAISPDKDIDGFHPYNFGKMSMGIDSFRPATPYGITKLLQHYDIETRGKHCVVIGRSNIVGKPISIMLGNDFTIGNCTVTLLHIETPRELLMKQCQMADIIVVAVGIKKFITSDMVKQGAIVIDVGINRTDDGRLVGDVDFENVKDKCSWITPVPGGVGPMTIASLMLNTLKSYKLKQIVHI